MLMLVTPAGLDKFFEEMGETGIRRVFTTGVPRSGVL
jgi:hypothetical protein